MRLIDANALIEESESSCWDIDLKELRMILKYVPTIDAVPVVRGEWVKSDDYKGWLVCSACHDCYVDNAWVNGKKWRHCPNCGAKMEVEHETD